MEEQVNVQWDYEIKPKKGIFSLNLKEIWQYRDLLLLFVKRDIITVYKQTILGPLWYLIQPLFTSVIFTIMFNNIADISTGPIPPFLFNLTGITAWNYFKECLIQTSDTFRKNQSIFGKVYFPRAIMPISIIVSGLLKMGIQLLILFGFYFYFIWTGKMSVDSFTSDLLYLPVLIFVMGGVGLGFGMIISSMVTKYRDLSMLVSFGLQLLMYLSAVVYPVVEVRRKIPEYSWIVEYNPLTQVIESFRMAILGTSPVDFLRIVQLLVMTIVVFLIGLVIFNWVERDFIDTV